MNSAICRRLPDTRLLRDFRVRLTQAGFRTRTLIVVKTLVEPAVTTHDEMATVYRQR